MTLALLIKFYREIIITLAVMLVVFLGWRWVRAREESAVLRSQIESQDVLLDSLSRRSEDAMLRVAELEGAPDRVITRFLPRRADTLFVASPPVVVNLLDTAAVRDTLNNHRALEDSLRLENVRTVRLASQAIDTLSLALTREKALTGALGQQVTALTERVALADRLTNVATPDWLRRHIGVSLGYGLTQSKGVIYAGPSVSAGLTFSF